MADDSCQIIDLTAKSPDLSAQELPVATPEKAPKPADVSTKTITPAKNTVLNYFTKAPQPIAIVEEKNTRKLAPRLNSQRLEEFQNRIDVFDAEINGSDNTTTTTYLKNLKSNLYKPFRVEKRIKGALRARLLQFSEDVRPPYFGTWQKKSKLITGRRPFREDTEVFDYDVDSEAEWDIGGPGESLKGDDSDDDDIDGPDDYEIDMKTFVPHGYVSDDEMHEDSDNEDAVDKEKVDKNKTDEITVSDDSGSVQIIADNNAKKPTKDQQTNIPKQTPKLDIKPIILGIDYANESKLSETKQQFLRNFRGVYI